MAGQGEITLHSKEHLMQTDPEVVMLRRQLLREIDKVKRDDNPIGLIRGKSKDPIGFEAGLEDSAAGPGGGRLMCPARQERHR
jgi:hypothetical protein